MSDEPSESPETSRRRRNNRLNMIGTGLIAILAVLAGVLLVNLVSSPAGEGTAGENPQTNSPTPTATAVPGSAAGPAAGSGTTPATVPTTTPAAPPPPEPTTAAPPPPPPPPPAAPTPSPVFEPVVILNDSTIQGQAQAAVERVEAAGFRVDRVGSLLNTMNTPVPTVFYDLGHEAAARTLKDRVRGVERIVLKSKANFHSSDSLILVVTRDFPTDLTEG